MARIAALFVAFVAWMGLLVQFQATWSESGSIPETVWILLRYFTVLTNVLVAVTMTIVSANGRLSPRWIGGATIAILLVGIVYMTLLRGLLELSGGALLADTLLHKVTPVLAAIWWVGWAPKGKLSWVDPLYWAAYPALYLAYALVRGFAERKYAYPFIDVGQLGLGRVLIYCAIIALLFIIFGLLAVWIDRWLGQQRARR